MSSKHKNLSLYNPSTMPEAAGFRFGIVVAEWNDAITNSLYEGCYQTLLDNKAIPENIKTVQVPGAFELVAAAAMLVKSNPNIDAIIVLGCVIKGETSHNEYINMSVAQGLQQLAMFHNRAFVFGLLTPNDQQQAIDRAGGTLGNKGIEAAQTAIRMAAIRNNLLNAAKNKIGF